MIPEGFCKCSSAELEQCKGQLNGVLYYQKCVICEKPFYPPGGAV